MRQGLYNKFYKRLNKARKHHLKELLFGLGVFALFAGGTVFLWLSSFTLPDLSSLNNWQVSQSTKIYDRTGEVLLYDLNQGVKRSIVPDSDISLNIKNATVAIEDSDFYQHHGIKFTSIFRAILADLIGGSYNQGGSTITQQVVKNTLLPQD